MPKPEWEGIGKQESIRGLRGTVERTTVKGGIYYPYASSVIEALVLFASGEFRPDSAGQSNFSPGVLPGGQALGEPGSKLGLLIEGASHDLRLGTPFTTEYSSTRANFPRRSTININGAPQKGYNGYVLEIANSDPDIPDSPATLRTVEEGIVAAEGRTQLTLAKNLILPIIVEDGTFGVDVRHVVGTVRQAIEDVHMSSFFSNPTDPFDRQWHNLVRTPYAARRLVRTETDTKELLQFKTSSNLVVDLGLQGVDLAHLKSRMGKLFGSVRAEHDSRPAFIVSIHDRDGLPTRDPAIDWLASGIKDAFERK